MVRIGCAGWTLRGADDTSQQHGRKKSSQHVLSLFFPKLSLLRAAREVFRKNSRGAAQSFARGRHWRKFGPAGDRAGPVGVNQTLTKFHGFAFIRQ